MAVAQKTTFASPWNDSDLVLVVEDKELNVHRWIVTSQSPVFKTMLEGNFQEASKDRIALPEKSYKSMLQFLKILYPSYMFEEAKSSLNDANLLPILPLADEYQCISLIKHCIDEAKITPGNVLELLPYVVKYRKPALPKLLDVLKWGTPTAKLKAALPKLDDTEDKDLSVKILLTKCCFLESSLVNMQNTLIPLLRHFLSLKMEKDEIKKTLGTLWDKYFSDCLHQLWFSHPTFDCSRCGRTIHVENVSSTKSCVNCMEKYKEKFIAAIPSCEDEEQYFKMLQDGQDTANAVNKSK